MEPYKDMHYSFNYNIAVNQPINATFVFRANFIKMDLKAHKLRNVVNDFQC